MRRALSPRALLWWPPPPLASSVSQSVGRTMRAKGGEGAKPKGGFLTMSRRTKRRLARLGLFLAACGCILYLLRTTSTDHASHADGRASGEGVARGGVITNDGDGADGGWLRGMSRHSSASRSSSPSDGDLPVDAPHGASCAARATLEVTARWTAAMKERAARAGSGAPGSAGSGAFRFPGPLVLNARMKRPPKVPKSNGEMEDLGMFTAAQRASLPERDILDTMRYESCAVVGNGGLLLMYEHGDLIDSHEAVIRFNDGTTAQPFTKHAGSKTTIRLVNSQHRGYSESDAELILQHLTAPAHLRLYLERRRREGAANRDYALTGAFYSFVRSKLQRMTPTNGMYGLYLAGALCDRVTIFGFLRTWYNDTRYHYHNPYEPTGTQGTRDSAEMPLIEALVRENPDVYSFGEPCVGPGAHETPCLTCPPGSTCAKGTWHPVPERGRCYRRREDCLTPAACAGCKGTTPATCVPSPGDYGCFQRERCYSQNVVNCFPKCGDPTACPGGKRGWCE